MDRAICNVVAKTLTSRWALLLLAVCWMLPAHAAQYQVTDLCVVAEMAEGSCAAYAINNAGVVAGVVVENNVVELAVWKHGKYTNLGAQLGSGIDSYPFAINGAGDIAGEVGPSSNSVFLAYFWHGDSGVAAGPVAYQSAAFGINAHGTLVGFSQQVFNGAGQAWVQNGARISYLPGLVVNPFDINAQGINDAGDVVGYSSVTAGIPGLPVHAVLWKQSRAIDLGTLPGAGVGAQSLATAINNTGTILGESDGPQGPGIVVVWKNGVIHALPSGALPGTSSSIAYGINDAGDVVGESDGYTKPQLQLATLWRDGRVYDLNHLIDPGVAKYVTLTAAHGINNAGWIAAWGVDSRYANQTHAYLLWLPGGEAATD